MCSLVYITIFTVTNFNRKIVKLIVLIWNVYACDDRLW